MNRGFALLLTLTLVSFIVLLLVGLATYTRVETAIAGNSQRQAQARENALFALNVAVGQLQKHAGPDTRATATAEAVTSVNAQKRRYTGVWSTTDATLEPVWLASGLETGTTPAVTGAIAAANQAVLVGANTDASTAANNVVATLQPINAPGIPGQTGSLTVGRYAWWVGDQGVKAPVAVPDASDTVDYAPYDSPDSRARLRQQMSLGAGAASTAGAPVFEPRDANNAALVAGQKVSTPGQFQFLRTPTNGSVGITVPRTNYHAWSPNNYAVLANTKLGGLRQDLSLQPTLLGGAFAAWADYSAYMEKFTPEVIVPNGEGVSVAPGVPASPIAPAYGTDPLRRRYKITPPTTANGAVFGVAPVLSFFGMSFSVRENPATTSLPQPLMEVAVRCVATLWNPYSSALVPESLKIEVTGLPVIRVEDSAGGNHALALQRWLTDNTDPSTPLRFSLPWSPEVDAVDQASWLPGRVYSWAAIESLSEPTGGNPMVFHHPDAVPPGAGEGVVRATAVHHEPNPPGVATAITRSCTLPAAATLQVRILRASDDTVLGTYTIAVDPFGPTTPLPVANKFVDFAIIRRLPQADELPATTTEKWLAAAGRDPRTPNFPASGFISGANGDDPALYGGDNIVGFAVRDVDRLLDRGGSSVSYNEDVPVFELPRAPILSLGLLQHLQLVDARPFALGNPWVGTAQINGINGTELFDRYFFSGLVNGVVPATNTAGDLILPNQLLKPLRKADQTKVTIDDVRALMAPPTTTDPDGNIVAGPPASSFSSKYFLQGGAFNLNSTNTAAWVSVLRGVRFPSPQSFNYLNADATTGTAADDVTAPVQSTDAQFFRFSQSAQETYKADAGQAGDDPSVPSLANTHLFRRGMRTLTAAQVAALATKVRDNVARKQTESGPFRSLEEFLSPNALFGFVDADGNVGAARSLLEAAIADSGVNDAIPEFSSQFLTQADIMTALAPVLFPRSDTFIVRTYGEAVNPATNVTEGRAWCEATVQRLPEYFDPTNAPEVLPTDPAFTELNRLYGRRFKVVSFRWLTRSDL